MSDRDATSPSGSAGGKAAAGEPRAIGRYLLFSEIAAGGMASVHLGRLMGAVGFARTVAIKRLLPHFGKEPEFIAMFMDEARIAARIRHPNVVSTLDVVAEGDELFLIMDYVEGESLSKLLRAASAQGTPAPRGIVLSVMYGALQGLHAAHEARNESGELLHVVHRDVSPQNILVGVDGTPRVLDFGIAKAIGRLSNTQSGHVKGKFAYMAPEQLQGGEITRRTDIYGASVVLWEALTGRRLFSGEEGVVIGRVLAGGAPAPSSVDPTIPPELDRVVLRGLAKDPEARFATALEMARAVGDAGALASALEIGEWVSKMAQATLDERAQLVSAVESSPTSRASRAPKPPESPADEQTAAATVHPAEPPTAVAALAPTLLSAEPPTVRWSAADARTVTGAGVDHDEADTRVAWRGPRGSGVVLSGRMFVLGALLIAGLVTLAVVALRSGSRPTAPQVVSSVAASPAPPAPAVSSTSAAAPQASPASSAPPASSVPAAAPPSRPARHRTVTHTAPARRAKPDCNPPSYIDKNGFKVFKPGCLH